VADTNSAVLFATPLSETGFRDGGRDKELAGIAPVRRERWRRDYRYRRPNLV